MSRYMFIQSQNPFTDVRANAQFDLAWRLAAAGNQVSLLLVQNGVSVARAGAVCATFDALSRCDIEICADSFSLQQRQIGPGELKRKVAIVDVDVVIDAMLLGDKVIWN